MDAIEGKLYSPFLKIEKRPIIRAGFKFDYEIRQSWERLDATVNKIRSGDGYPVTTFRNLIDEVALVTISNKSYEMFYRGQAIDYKDRQSKYYNEKEKRSIIYPTICRPERNPNGTYKYSVKQNEVNRRYEELYHMIRHVSGGWSYHMEYYLALFQHYDILPTPLIDITQSLRVAASFALQNSKSGYLYVFGLPYPNQSISHYTDMGIVLVKLQNVCPVKALRPRYQEGYLVGKYPFEAVKEGRDNLARRLVAKFRLDNSHDDFWDNDFLPMPNEVLYPQNDEVEIYLRAEKEKFMKRI